MFENPKVQYVRILEAAREERRTATRRPGQGPRLARSPGWAARPNRARAVAIVVALLVVAACSSDDVESAAESSPSSSVAAAGPTAPPSTARAADEQIATETLPSVANGPIGLVHDYVDAINSGDVDRALSRLVEDGRYAQSSVSGRSAFDVEGYQDYAELIAWATTSDLKFADLDCSLAPATPNGEVVDCVYSIEYRPRVEVGETRPPGAFLITVSPDETFRSIDQRILLRPSAATPALLEWIATGFPADAALAQKTTWSSIEEAVASAVTRDQYIDWWAASLDDG